MSFVEKLFKYGDYTHIKDWFFFGFLVIEIFHHKGMHQNRKMGHHVISASAIDFASFGVAVRF
jgi:hypothetical protein